MQSRLLGVLIDFFAYDVSLSQGGGNVDEALVAGAAELQCEVALLVNELAVDEYIDIAEQLVHSRVAQGLQFLERIARVAPDVQTARMHGLCEAGERRGLGEGLAPRERDTTEQRVLVKGGEDVLGRGELAARIALRLGVLATGAAARTALYEHGKADTFAIQQMYVKPLLPYEIFVANLEAGNDKQLMIKALVESLDLTIGPTKALGTICAVSSLEEIYDKHGYHVLERTLMLCIGAWEGEQNSLSANMLRGVCRLVVAFGDSMRDDMFVEKVGRFSAKDISRTAKERRAGSLGYAEAMLLAYNRKMRYPLRWGKLYNKKGVDDTGPDVETDMEPDDSEDD